MRTAASRPVSCECRGIGPALVLSSLPLFLTGCSSGAPSFTLFGAFFPAWLLCGVVGIVAALVARATFVATGLAQWLPYQLAVCTAVGVSVATLAWLIPFGP
jgi:hypothetical protein